MTKSIYVFCGLIGAFLSGAWLMSAIENESLEDPQAVVEISDLIKKRADSKKSYLPFLNISSMHCGVYHIPAGGKDGQSPHTEDEVYYVENGEGQIHIDGEDHKVKPGSVIFVKAHDKHYFHSVTKDLDLLVFFSKKKPE